MGSMVVSWENHRENDGFHGKLCEHDGFFIGKTLENMVVLWEFMEKAWDNYRKTMGKA